MLENEKEKKKKHGDKFFFFAFKSSRLLYIYYNESNIPHQRVLSEPCDRQVY